MLCKYVVFNLLGKNVVFFFNLTTEASEPSAPW